MFGLGVQELAIIAFVLVLFFGRDKLVDLARGSGEAIKEFKNGIKDATDDVEEEIEDVKKEVKKKSTSKKKSTKK